MNTLIWVVNIVSQWEWIEAVHVSNTGRLPWWLQSGSHLAPGHSQIYLEAMEKNREKAWYQYYVTDRKWWTQFHNDGKVSTQHAASTASDCRCFADGSDFATKSLGNSVAKFLKAELPGIQPKQIPAGMFDEGKEDREGREKRGKKTREWMVLSFQLCRLINWAFQKCSQHLKSWSDLRCCWLLACQLLLQASLWV